MRYDRPDQNIDISTIKKTNYRKESRVGSSAVSPDAKDEDAGEMKNAAW